VLPPESYVAPVAAQLWTMLISSGIGQPVPWVVQFIEAGIAPLAI
jgi:hypothetical protein